MQIRHLFLYCDRLTYRDKKYVELGFQTRYLCYFLQKKVRTLKFPSDGFSKICIQPDPNPTEECPIVPERALVVTVAFDEDRYGKLAPGEHHEFFIAMLVEGLEKCARHQPIPLAEFKLWIDEFRAGGYRNEWVHKSRLLRPVGLRASMLCSLDTNRFELTLELKRKNAVVFSAPIFRSKPDELCFDYKVHDLALEEEMIVVRDKLTRPVCLLHLGSLPGLKE